MCNAYNIWYHTITLWTHLPSQQTTLETVQNLCMNSMQTCNSVTFYLILFTAPIIFGQMHFLLISENEIFHEKKLNKTWRNYKFAWNSCISFIFRCLRNMRVSRIPCKGGISYPEVKLMISSNVSVIRRGVAGCKQCSTQEIRWKPLHDGREGGLDAGC